MSTDIDTRLARLAPSGPPDPARHEAARRAVEAAVDAAVEASLRDAMPPGPDDVDPVVTVDVVVPRRPRRWTRAAFAVAAAAVIAVGVTALLAQPSLTARLSPAARAAAVDVAVQHCQEADPDPADPTPLAPVVSEVRGDTVLTLLGAGAQRDRAVFCAEEVGAQPGTGGIGWSDVPRGAVAGAALTYEGAGGGGDDWHATWGYAGRDVAAVTVTTDTGDVLEATVADGYWVAWWPPGTSSVDRPAGVAWRTHDGRSATSSLAELDARSAPSEEDDG